MKKFLLASVASALILAPAAQAAQQGIGPNPTASAEYKRSEGRNGGWVRGQGPVADQSQDRGQRERGWRRDSDAQQSNRRGGWNGQASPSAPQGGSWNRGEERREQSRDDNRRYDDRRDGRWDRRGDDDRWRNRDDGNWRNGDQRWGYDRRDSDRRWDRDGRYDRRDNDRWDRDWRSDRRYDWRGHRERYRSYYRPGRYYAPYRSDRYRRFSVGISIGTPFYASRYWIADPWQYRLPPARGPYRWVRYYDDVLLVDVRNGYVIDVIHDFFW